jgi:hypothetical protein
MLTITKLVLKKSDFDVDIKDLIENLQGAFDTAFDTAFEENRHFSVEIFVRHDGSEFQVGTWEMDYPVMAIDETCAPYLKELPVPMIEKLLVLFARNWES